QAEDGIRDFHVTGVQTCALPISLAQAAANQAGETQQEQDKDGNGVQVHHVISGRRIHIFLGRLRQQDGTGRQAVIACLQQQQYRDRKSVVEGKSVESGSGRLCVK